MGDGEKKVLVAEITIAKKLREHLAWKGIKVENMSLVMQERLLPKYQGAIRHTQSGIVRMNLIRI